MLYTLAVVALLGVASANGPHSGFLLADPSNSTLGAFTKVEQTVCQDSACSKNCKTTSLAIGECVPDTAGGALEMSCSDDGSTFTQTQYSDKTCKTQTRAIPGNTGTCYNAGGPYVEFTC